MGQRLPLILGLVNTLAVLGVLGFAVYTKVLYKRPTITEHGERERLSSASPAPVASPGRIEFKPMTLNIRPNPAKPGHDPSSGTLLAGKPHYAQMGFTLELRDAGKSGRFEEVRPIFMDQLHQMMAKKTFEELTTVQGRFLLRTEILDLVNGLVREPIVTGVFFDQFVVQ